MKLFYAGNNASRCPFCRKIFASGKILVRRTIQNWIENGWSTEDYHSWRSWKALQNNRCPLSSSSSATPAHIVHRAPHTQYYIERREKVFLFEQTIVPSWVEHLLKIFHRPIQNHLHQFILIVTGGFHSTYSFKWMFIIISALKDATATNITASHHVIPGIPLFKHFTAKWQIISPLPKKKK